MTITNIRNPRWADRCHEKIYVDIQIDGDPESCVFLACADDSERHGREIHAAVMEGKYGPIEDSNECKILAGKLPVPEGLKIVDGKLINYAQAEFEATGHLNSLLDPYLTTEAQAKAIIDDAYAATRKAAMSKILAVKQQDGWPLSVDWPA
jgi:hypothetical protein